MRLTELFERIVSHRNKEIGHGALGQREERKYDRLSIAMLKGVEQILQHFDVLAGRRLVFVEDVRRQPSGNWIVDRFELIGESGRRLEPVEIPDSMSATLPRPELVYLERTAASIDATPRLALHPLVHYRPDSGDFFFLNSRRGKRDVEFLCYQDGETLKEIAHLDQCGLLARILKVDVSESELDEWSAKSFVDDASARPEEAASEQAEHTIGEFELLSRLGKGGMGIVYRAWQPSLGRQVALKSMLPGDSKTEARFGREIRALGKIEHPNVVKVFTSGSVGERWFYVMELIEGADLGGICQQLAGRNASEIDSSNWLEAVTTACAEARSNEAPLSTVRDQFGQPRLTAKRLSGNSSDETVTAASSTPPILNNSGYVAQVVALIQKIASATNALHDVGVVHRDIKPGNIMITHDGKTPILMDLGLAQLADEADGRLTRTRQFVGTLRYASPEQVLAAGKVDRRTDVYSLGATLWELLTLHPIFGATDETPTPELMLRIQTTEAGSPRKYNAKVPRDLDSIVRKCLEKDRSRRYSTAAELAEDLQRFLAGEVVIAQPPSLTYLSGKFISRYRVPLAAALFMIGVLMIGAVFAFIGIDRERREAIRQKSVAIAALEKIKEESYATSIAVAERELTLKQDMDLADKLLENCPEHLRGWEWNYLKRLRDGERPPFPSSEFKVGSGLWMAVFSPDGRLFATSSVDGIVRVGDVASGREIDTFQPHPLQGIAQLGNLLGKRVPVTCLSFSPNGQFLATGSVAPDEKNLMDLRKSKGSVRIWDISRHDRHEMIVEFKEQLGVVLSLDYSRDGRQIASSSMNEDNTFTIWDANSGAVVRVMRGHSSHIHRLRYSPDGRLLASASTDGAVKLWDASTLEIIRSLDAHPAPVIDLAFAPDCRRFATAGEDGTVRIWETATGASIKKLRGHTGSALGVAFSPDSKRIASGGFDKTVRLWDAESFEEKLTLRGHREMVWSVNFSPDGNQLLSASFDGHAQIWDATPRIEERDLGVFTLTGHEDRVNSVAFSPDGKYLASGSWDYTILLWNAETGAQSKALRGHERAVWSIAFSPDGKRLASASWDNKLKMWDVDSGKEVMTLEGHTAPAHSIAYSPDGNRVVSGGFDGRSKVWDLKTKKMIAVNNGNMFPTFSVAFSPDGKRAASAGASRTIVVWNADNGKELFSLKGHEASIVGVTFSPDGKLIASASFDRTARIWDADPQKGFLQTRELKTIDDHSDHVNSVAFSRDGTMLATGSEDKTAIVWDVKTWKRVMPPLRHRSVVWSVAFSPDGRRLATGGWSRSGWIRTWRVKQ